MNKKIIFSLLALLLVSLAFALELEPKEISEDQITKFKGNTSYVNHTKADISQEPYNLTSKDEARINFKSNYEEDEFDICFDFPIQEDKIEVKKLEKNGLFGLFDTNLNELNRSGKRICTKSFSNNKEVDIDYQFIYNGIGTIKYNVTIMPSKYHQNYTLARSNDDLVVLDPYLIGDLKEKTKLYIPFDGDINALSTTLYSIGEEGATSERASGDWVNPANMYDGDFATYANHGQLSSEYFYVNYSKYLDSISAIWTVKDGDTTRNIEIPQDCFNEYNDIIRLRVKMLASYSKMVNYECYYNSAWQLLLWDGVPNTRFYEENITWSVINSTPSPYNTSYHIWGSQGYDFKLLGASTDIFGTDDGVTSGAVFNGEGLYFSDQTDNVSLDDIDLEDTGFSIYTTFRNERDETDATPDYIFYSNDSNFYLKKYQNDVQTRYLLLALNTSGERCDPDNLIFNGLNEWNHLAIIYNGTDFLIYNDNELIDSSYCPNFDTDSGNIKTIGNSNGYSSAFNGTIRNFYIYNYSLTETEISYLYTNGSYIDNIINESEKAISFYDNGIKDGIRLQDQTTYDLKGGSTFAFWAKDDGVTNVKQLLGLSYTDNTNKITLYNTNTGFNVESNTNSDACYGSISQDNEWHHYVLKVLDYECSIYEDGTAITMTDNTLTDNITLDMVGRTQMDADSNPYGYDGGIDELMIFDYALSESEIRILSGGYNSSINISFYDVETDELITNSITVDIYSDDLNFSKSSSSSGGSVYINGLPEGTLRLTYYGSNYNTNVMYYTITESNAEYSFNAYLTNKTSENIKDVIVQVRDNANHLLPNAEVKLYILNQTNYVLVSSKTTNLNGEVVMQTTLGENYYKLSLYYGNEKCYETESSFLITANDDYIYLRCNLENDYIETRDVYNAVTTSLNEVNTSNNTGYFTFEGSSTSDTEFCLYVYEDTYYDSTLIDSNCATNTTYLSNIYVNTSNKTGVINFRGVGLYKPSGYDEYKIAGLKVLTFEISNYLNYGIWGVFLAIIILCMVILYMFEAINYIPIAIGITYFLMTWFRLIKIPMFTDLGSGITVLILSLIVQYTISVRKSE